MTEPTRDQVLNEAYAQERRIWGAALTRWLAANRPDHLELRAEDADRPEPPHVGGQRDGCRQPGACASGTPDLCRQCAAIVSSMKGVAA
jgi:hypothetical protein